MFTTHRAQDVIDSKRKLEVEMSKVQKELKATEKLLDLVRPADQKGSTPDAQPADTADTAAAGKEEPKVAAGVPSFDRIKLVKNVICVQKNRQVV